MSLKFKINRRDLLASADMATVFKIFNSKGACFNYSQKSADGSGVALGPQRVKDRPC